MSHLTVPAILLATACAHAPVRTDVATGATPPGTPVHTYTADETKSLLQAMEPYVAQARATYPEAKRRFLEGLPHDCSFFITVRLHDSQGRVEQVSVVVKRIENGQVTGRIQDDVSVVRRFSRGQRYTFPETGLIDWRIAKPDGAEDGNYVGKFLDEWRKTHH